MTNAVRAPGVRTQASANAVALDATGVILTYTPPTNRRGTITSIFLFTTGTLGVVDLEYLDGATVITLGRTTAGDVIRIWAAGVQVDPGDSFRLNVSTAFSAGATGDVYIGVSEEA